MQRCCVARWCRRRTEGVDEVRLKVVSHAKCVLLSNRTSIFERVLLSRGTTIISGTFHEGSAPACYCQFSPVPEIFVECDSTSASRMDIVESALRL